MKRLQRIVLGIIRRPLKSFILLMVVFVMGNVISGSLILYKTSNSIKEEIMAQAAPIIRIRTPIDLGYISRFGEIINHPYDANEKMKFILLEENAYDEILNLPEVKYADYGLYSKSDTIDKNPKVNPLRKEYVDEYLVSHHIGVGRTDFYHLDDRQIKIVEGRNFTQEEIEEGRHVVLVPKNFFKYNNKNKARSYQVGETITLKSEAFSKKIDIYYLDIFKENKDVYNCYYEDECEYTPEQMNQMEQEIKDSLVISKELELTIIGIYEIVNYDKYYNIPDYYEYMREPLIYMPRKLLKDYRSGFLDEVKKYNLENSTELFGTYKANSKNAYNYIELNHSDDVPLFTKKAKEILNKYGLDEYKIETNMDNCLQVVGPLAALNDVSKYMITVAIVVSFIILSVVSLLFLKERRKEIAILLSLGESKKHVVIQMFAELFIIGMMGIGCSMMTVNRFSSTISNNILESYHPVTLTEEQKEMLPDYLTPKYILNQYETQLASTDVTSVIGVSGLILIVSSGVALFVILKAKPKDLLS